MKRNSQIIYWFTLLIISLFVVVACDSGQPNPAPDMPLQQTDTDGEDGEQEVPDFYVELLSNGTSVTEGEVLSFKISNPSELDQDVEVELSYSGSGQYGQDFTIEGPDVLSVSEDGATITISKSLKEATVDIVAIRDGVSEGTESVTISLNEAIAEDGTTFTVGEEDRERFSAAISINSIINVAAVGQSEIETSVNNNRTVFIPVTLDLPAISQTTFNYTVSQETGYGGDYFVDKKGGSLEFEEGDSEQKIELSFNDLAYNVCGDISLRVTIDNVVSNDQEVEISANDNDVLISFPTGPACLTYCSADGGTVDEWIQRFAIGSIDNNSGDNDGYADFTNLYTNLQRGAITNLTYQAGYSASYWTDGYVLYIDLDQDGVFANSEVVWTGIASNPSPYNSSFTMPSNAKLGQTRMRLVMQYSAYGGPCGNRTWGEIEDYTVYITDSPVNGPTIGSGSQQAAKDLDDVNIIILKNSEPGELDVKLNDTDLSAGIKIYNSTNVLVKTISPAAEEMTIDVSDLPNGTYVLKVVSASLGITVSTEFVVK